MSFPPEQPIVTGLKIACWGNMVERYAWLSLLLLYLNDNFYEQQVLELARMDDGPPQRRYFSGKLVSKKINNAKMNPGPGNYNGAHYGENSTPAWKYH